MSVDTKQETVVTSFALGNVQIEISNECYKDKTKKEVLELTKRLGRRAQEALSAQGVKDEEFP